jgi:hypothetical protein
VRRVLLACAAILLVALRASAAGPDARKDFQQTIDEVLRGHFEMAPAQTLSEALRLDYGAYTTFAYLSEDDLTGTARGFSQIDSKFWLQAQKGGHTFYGRMRLNYENYDAGDAFTASGDGFIEPLFDRYWYRFDWRSEERVETGADPSWDWWVQVGRQYVNWGSGMTLSDALYAVRAGAEARSFSADILLGLTPEHTTDFDGSRPSFDSNTKRSFWGISTECRALRNHRPFLYFLGQEDNNAQPFGPLGPLFKYDSRYVGAGATGEIVTGTWLYRLELIYEFGHSVSDAFVAPQTSEHIEAYALRFYLAYLPPRARERIGLRIETEFLMGSGDPDRGTGTQTAGGNLSGTKDESFIAFGYVNTGLALAPEISNLVSFRITGSAFPLRGHGIFDRMQVSLSGFVFAKYDSDAPISVPTVAGKGFIGGEIDLALDWKFTSDLDLIAQYGVFLPGDAMIDSSALQFFYVGFSYGF